LYKDRRITSPEDAYRLLKEFMVDSDRERFVVVCLDTKNQPTAINICHVESLNASIVHPREVMKAAILSNSSSIIVAHNHLLKTQRRAKKIVRSLKDS
jgi:DNA repair protein RadC